ncbi:uncharacterized protein LOC135495943 isoform X2 [Lineus longissimus]|uniref:uncharacterized protein LOC135495943 isoform X2 n=1 Tax=Lineus longissimus TaxID=88925 RepID=UPI00315CEB0E
MNSGPVDSRGYTSQYPAMEVVYKDGKVIPKMSEPENMDLPPKTQKKDTVRWKDVLYEFTQASTIHGLNHITEDTPFKLRRIIWIILVIAGACLFVLQVMQSVIMYYSRPVTVNVKVNYNDTLVFPAITICNQNSFRITESVRHGYYDVLTKAFASHHHEDGDGGKGHHEPDGSAISREDKLHKMFEEISMADVYNKTSHTIADMIISCQWDGRPCLTEDIVSTSTDHGACMTFNGGTRAPIKKVTRIGSNGGLRLRLNIEQYEYMSGPIEGAGIKILLHDQQEIPMVRYLGQAIPPGAHALVGLSILQVGNLKYPYGRCSDDKKLEYYNHYSVSACLLDCRQKYLMKACQCRDVYMSSGTHPHHNDTVPICTLNQYLTCLVKNLGRRDHVRTRIVTSRKELRSETYQMPESYEMDEEECSCPIPCKQTIYDPSITHATLSQFDRQKILLSNKKLRDSLQTKFQAARETRHRVDTDILMHDSDLLIRFLSAATKLEATFEGLRHMSTRMMQSYHAMFQVWQTNYHFHRWGALAMMEYMIKHNFQRGWDVVDERTFRFLTFNYKSFMANIGLNLRELVRTQNMTSSEMLSYRDVITWQIKKDLALRIDVTERGFSNITKIYEGYAQGKLLSIYKYTYDAKYDSLYTPLCLENDVMNKRNVQYYAGMKIQMDGMIDTLNGYMNITNDVCHGHSIDNGTLKKLNKDFETFSKGINYRLFIYKDRVVDFSLRETEEKLIKFDQLVSKLEELKHQLDIELQTLGDALARFLDTDWGNMRMAKLISSQYLRDKSVKKMKLADVILNDKLQASVLALKKVIPDVTARSRDLKDTIRRLKEATFNVYHSIMADNCTNVLYEYLRNDTDRIRENRTYLTQIRRVFKELLKRRPVPEGGRVILYREIEAMSADKLAEITNANLSTLEEKDAELGVLFSRFERVYDFNRAFNNADVNFTDVFNELKGVLMEYKTTGKISTDFLRDNILNVDVFLRELSYEEIQQQKAYELTNLWSDIGGSLGLFIGASVLTLAELIDVIVHTFLRKHSKKKS